MVRNNKTTKTQRRKEAQRQDKSVLVELENPELANAFGDPFMLQNFRFDEGVYKALLAGDADPDDPDEDIEKDDIRVIPLVHADLAYAIEYFLRARNAQTRENLVVSAQTDADHIHDLGEALQVHHKGKEGANLQISKADHRWLLQKAKELAHKAFPIDARMFIDCLEIDKSRPEEAETASDATAEEAA